MQYTIYDFGQMPSGLRIDRRAIGGEVDYAGDLIERTKAESSRVESIEK
jgi:hypothetical protein